MDIGTLATQAISAGVDFPLASASAARSPDFGDFLFSALADLGVDPRRGDGRGDRFLLPFLLARWLSVGLPVFRPSESLAAGLLLTDPGEVLEAEPWPFPAFLVEFPPGVAPREGGSRVRFAGFLDVLYPAVGRVDARGEVPRDRVLMSFALADRVGGDRTYGLTVHEPREFGEAPPEFTEGERRAATACARLLLGAARWVAERGRGARVRASSGASLRARAMGRRPVAAPEVWEIGREVRLPPEVLELAADVDRAPRALWRVRARFCVRGHWRNQACGPGRLERRRTWVAPFWKGPADGARLAHLYRGG